MQYTIFYAPEALRDLEEIHAYIAEDLANPGAADSAIDRIFSAIDHLSVFPRMGAALSSIVPIDSDYRFIHAGSYIVFYRIRTENVYIDRILYGKRNYLQVLFPDERE